MEKWIRVIFLIATGIVITLIVTLFSSLSNTGKDTIKMEEAIKLIYQEISYKPENLDIYKDSMVNDEAWDNLFSAICYVESRMDPLAYNKTSGAAGICQQKKIYVDDINRILGYYRYNYEDRFSPNLAREMFEISQGYYNPNRDHIRAMGIHYIGPRGYSVTPDEAKTYICKVQKELEKYGNK